MHDETASLLSLGDCNPELAEKIRLDIEKIVAAYIANNTNEVGARILGFHVSTLERVALRALKNHLNSVSDIY
jgi:hypothetical protein